MSGTIPRPGGHVPRRAKPRNRFPSSVAKPAGVPRPKHGTRPSAGPAGVPRPLVAEVSGFTNHGHGDALLAAVIDRILCLTLSPKERVCHIDLLPTPLQAAFPCP